MKTQLNKIKRATLAVAIALTGCAPQRPEFSITAMPTEAGDLIVTKSLVPKPADPASERSQLSRYKGQTQFLNLASWYDCQRCQPQQEQKEDQSGEQRAEQESDIFKIGAPGSKLLYLMNNYRGLQVVSFAKGILNPELLGRTGATGNSPDEMYMLPESRILAIEHVYRWSQGDPEDDHTNDEPEFLLHRTSRDESYSRMLVYDVSNSSQPKLKQAIDASGFIVDSRIVGDVLYVATKRGQEGLVTSYSLKGAAVKTVAQHALSLKVSNTQNMNILTVDKGGGQFSYYLVATLSEKEWGWWDDSNIIEVVDISSAKGAISPVMAVAARGVVRERSQTMIKNDTLVVTSNYNVRDQSMPARIAVETFRLPNAQSEIITEREETYRRLHIERQLQGLSGKQRDETFDKLANDPKLGIRGRFVRTDSGTYRKLINDSIVTVGDGSGLDANLRDVRYQGDLMYAFWVPANEIDPFDLFDISHPEQGVKYLNRLHFEGWIDRAVPFVAGGRRFVLGLGWIIPVVNDDTGRRQPQAMLFEIVEQGGKLRSVDVAQLSFEGSDIWTDFNGQDKLIEVRFQADGKGEVLFGAQKWDRNDFAAGGQTVRFDAGAVIRGEAGKALTKGDFLNGGADWIRRVFTNTEIDRVNSFSDSQLATYDAATPNGGGDLHPVSVLELARDIRAFHSLGGYGVQVIEDSGWWYDSKSKTELRLVDPAKADTEKSGAYDTLSIPGTLIDSLIEPKTGHLLIQTVQYQHVRRQNGGYDYSSTVRVLRIATAKKSGPGGSVPGFLVLGEVNWTTTNSNDPEPIGKIASDPVQSALERSLVILGDGTVLAQANSTLQKLDLSASGLTATPVTYADCASANREDLQLLVVEGKPFVASVERFDGREFPLRLERRFLAKATLAGAVARCEVAINIPGRPLLATPNGILVSDQWVEDIHGRQEDEIRVQSANSLLSLKLDTKAATLIDEEPLTNAYPSYSTVAGRLARVEKGQQLQFLALSADAEITKATYAVDLSLGAEASLATVLRGEEGQQGEWVGIVRAAGKMQTIRWTDSDPRPSIVKMQVLDPQFQKSQEAEVISLTNGWYGTDYHYSRGLNTLEVSQGLTGIAQIVLNR